MAGSYTGIMSSLSGPIPSLVVIIHTYFNSFVRSFEREREKSLQYELGSAQCKPVEWSIHFVNLRVTDYAMVLLIV